MTLTPAFRAVLDAALAASPDAGIAQRNPGEPFRQLLACMLEKLDGALARAAHAQHAGPAYESADGLIADLRTLERQETAAHTPAAWS